VDELRSLKARPDPEQIIIRVRELPHKECKTCYWRWHDECRHKDADDLVEGLPGDGCNEHWKL
jgi:hypothetical protein